MQLRSRRARVLVAATALAVPIGFLASVQPAVAAPNHLVAIGSTLPRWLPKATAGARSRVATRPADAKKDLSIRVYLAPKGGQAALEQAVAAVSDPSSPSYAHFISAQQYETTYAPTAASATSVTRWLAAQHLKVTGTEANRRWISAQGNVAQLDKAFGVSLSKLSHDGQDVIAPTTAALVPSGVASSILTVSGLDTTRTLKARSATPKTPIPEAFQNARPCSIAYGQLSAKYQGDYKTPLPKFDGQTLPYAPCGYAGPQLRSAYTPGTKLTGAGVTVAITDAYAWPLIGRDVDKYATEHGDGHYPSGQLKEVLPSSFRLQDECDPAGWSGEGTLDVEAVHALAPKANIRYYAASSCDNNDLRDALARVVDEDVAKVVTNSWGGPEQGDSSDSVVADNQVFLQGALQGITFMFSSGDDGDELAATGLKQASSPANNPNVTAVGGTSTGIDDSGKRIFDAGWGTVKDTLSADGKSWSSIGFTSGAGGGYSAVFDRPAYQQGVVPASAPPGRAFPDIAMDADPNTGFLVGQTQAFPDGVHYGEYRIGGTSLASPLAAAMLALTIQHNGGRAFGALNPRIYATAGVADDVTPQPSRLGVVRADYTDPTRSSSKVVYSVREFDHDSSLATAKGWDPVTGVGVPNAKFLALTTPVTSAAAAVKR